MTHTFLGIDHVQLAAPPGCEAEARAFYGDVLGLQEIEKPANLRARGGVWFQCGSQQIHIGVQPDFHPATKAHPAFTLRNLPSLRQRLSEHRVAIIEDEPLPRAIRFYVTDPFGNRIEFLEETG